MLQPHQQTDVSNPLREELKGLMQQTGQQCLTLLCPLHPANPDRSVDRISLKQLSQQAALSIRQHWPGDQADQLLLQLEVLMSQIDLTRPPKGLGIYLCNGFQFVKKFPFTVPPLIQVDDRFLIRELIWYAQLTQPVYVLNVSEQSARLDEVRNGDWFSIRDDHFPAKYYDDHEYAKPVRSSSYAGHAHVKNYERDKTEMQHIRFRQFFQDTDRALRAYLLRGEPLILTGAERDLSGFRQISDHDRNIIAQITGNFQYAHQEIYLDKINHAIGEYRQSKMQQEVALFFESWGSGMARCGISDCWEAVEAGQGRMLLVERGYREGIYRSPAGTFSKNATAAGSVWYPDVLDALMHRTFEKGGDVKLVENNALSSAQRVALTLRYPS